MGATIVPGRYEWRDETPYSTAYGDVYHSADGGLTWSAQTTPVGPVLGGLTAVDFLDGNVGVAVGGLGTAFRTTNGGQTWTAVDCGAASANLSTETGNKSGLQADILALINSAYSEVTVPMVIMIAYLLVARRLGAFENL